MSNRYPGGLITKTPVTPTLSSAPGVWTLEQALAYIKAGTWPYQGALDPYFNQTTLLLHGDGNQGATNLYNSGSPAYLAFADNSNNNFPITVNGDAYGTTVSPYQENYSNYFDGSGDYLNVPDSDEWNLSNGDFTIEGWVYIESFGSDAYVAPIGQWSVSNRSWIVYLTSSTIQFSYSTTGSSQTNVTGSTTNTLNTWMHFAITRTAGSVYIFKNGELLSTTSVGTTAFYNSTRVLHIGATQDGSYAPLKGYISNLRVVKGTAVYTSAFTPPTAPLTAISGTSLLTCQSNRFIDNSSNNFTITRLGDTRISPFQPFTLAANDYGSGYFDGSGDFLSVANNTAFQFSTGNFTVEFWVYANVSGSNHGLVAASLTGSGYWASLIFSGLIYWQSQNGTTNLLSASYFGYYNKWTHVAFVRNSGTTKLYLDGIEAASASDSTNYNGSSGNYDIGRDQDNAAFLNGYMSDLRIVKGTAVYTSNFTPPTAPLTAITNTSLLTCQYSGTVNNTGFIDSGPNYFPITKFGNATQGTFSPFSVAAGEWSNYFDGSGDFLSVPNNSAIHVLGSDFCLEGWFYLTAAQTNAGLYSTYNAGPDGGYLVRLDTSVLRFFYFTGSGSITIDRSFTFAQGQWYHFAVTNSGGTGRIFVNGVQQGATFTISATANSTQTLQIGRTHTVTNDFPGYLSNFRVVKGSAVYTSNFTPSTTPLTAITNTSLLTCQSNRFVDNSTNAFAITRTGDVRVTPFSPFLPTAPYSINVNGGSGYFDGTGDYLAAPRDVWSALGTNTWTIGLWVYHNEVSTQQWYVSTASSNVTSNFGMIGGGQLLYQIYNGNNQLLLYSTINMVARQWTYLTLSHSGGGTYQIQINGVSAGTSAASGFYWNTAGSPTNFSIGYYAYDGARSLNGYMSGLRIKQGVDLAVPTAPPTSTSSDILLLNFTSAGIFDQTGKNVLEIVGNAQVDTSVRKYGTGSMEFDGTGDYLLYNLASGDDLGNGNFTVECWFYLNITGSQRFISARDNSAGLTIGVNNPNIITTFYGEGTGLINGASVTTGAWNHVAVVRSSGTTTLYLNGVSQGTSNWSAKTFSSTQYRIGTSLDTRNESLNGYIDDLRITKGVARYTTNFTPPTRAFPNQ